MCTQRTPQQLHPPGRRWARVLALCMLALAVQPPLGVAADSHDPTAGEGATSPLEPTFEPVPPPEPKVYTTEYLFAMTRGIADSTLVPALKLPIFLLTIPLDTALLPVGLLAGFFPTD